MPENEKEPAEVVTAATADQAEEPAEDDSAGEPREGREAAVTCHHCGEEVEGVEADTDFLCPHCERYQDSMICPTCHQIARASLMEGGA